MHEIIISSAVVTLLSAFIMLFIGKVGLRELIIQRSKIKVISELFECDFCLSFWISLILAIILAIIYSNIDMIIIPFLSTPITRFLI